MKLSHLVPLLFTLVAGTQASPSLRQRQTISSDNFTKLQTMAQWTAASFCNAMNTLGQPITCGESACPSVTANGATTLGTFIGPGTDIEGFVGLDPTAKLIVAAFRGTQSFKNWATDADFPLRDCDLLPQCKAHTGFLDAWGETSDNITRAVLGAAVKYPGYTIVMTGHSLGAAVATLAAATLRAQAGLAIDLYTYGSPRVGNRVLADFITQQPGANFRVTHTNDIVPRLPSTLVGYHHTGTEYWLSTGNDETVNYTSADVVICAGNDNDHCNAGQNTMSFKAHKYYFERMSICSTTGNALADLVGT